MNVKTDFQKKCDTFSKISTVFLGFIIPISTAMTYPVLLCLIVSWFLAGDLSQKTRYILKHPVARAVFWLCGLFTLGILYSKAPMVDILETTGKMVKILYIPFLLPLMVEKKWRQWVIKAFIGAMLLTLVLSFLKVNGILMLKTRFSSACIFKDHIYTNLLMAFVTYLISHYTITYSEAQGAVKYGLYALITCLIYYVLFMSEGRSGYVVFAVLWSLLFLQRFGLKGLVVGLVGLSLLMGVVGLKSNRFQTRWMQIPSDVTRYKSGDANTSTGQRMEFAKETFQLVLQRPWFGWGTGSFKGVYEEHAKQNEIQVTRNPHNEYLNVLLQLGLLGLMGFLGFFWSILKNSFRLPSFERWWAQGALAAIAIGCFANSWIMDFTAGYFFVLMIAVCFGALKHETS